jgi:putative endonuclease
LQKSSNHETGIKAEKLAAALLRKKGYEIVARRVGARRGTDAGEVDIVALKGRMLVFVEVKKRKTHTEALESIMSRQQARVYRAAELFLAQNPQYAGYDCRFDAIAFDGAYVAEHVENAWGL